jgi:hypothetical protein
LTDLGVAGEMIDGVGLDVAQQRLHDRAITEIAGVQRGPVAEMAPLVRPGRAAARAEDNDIAVTQQCFREVAACKTRDARNQDAHGPQPAVPSIVQSRLQTDDGSGMERILLLVVF